MPDTVDARIPLAVNPPPDFIRNMAGVQGLVQNNMALQQERQAAAAQVAMKNVFADPANLGSDGALKPEALAQIYAVDPKAGMAMQQFSTQQQKAKLDIKGKEADITLAGHQMIEDKVRGPSSIAYQRAIERGLTPDAAKQVAQQVYNDGMKDVSGSGLFSEQQIQQMPPDFNFDRVSSRSQQYLAFQEKQRADKLAERKEASTERHLTAEEGIQRAQLGQGAQRIGLERDRLQFERGQAALPNYHAPVEVQFKGDDGKPRQAMAQQDNNPRSPTYGQWVTADEKRSPISAGDMRVVKADTPLPGDESIDGQAKLIAEYRQAPLSGFAQGKPLGAAVMARVRELNPEYDATTYAQRTKAARDFGTGPQGNTARSLNVATEHLEQLSDLSKALNNRDAKSLNNVVNALKEQFGVTAPGNFNAAKEIVADEVAKAIIGSGGAGALADREGLKAQLAAAKSPEQLAGVIETYQGLMAGQLVGLRQQYQRTTGRKSFDDDFLTEKTQDVLDRHGRSSKEGGSRAAVATPGEFVEGKVYVDANGHKAKYVGGKWVEQ